MSRPVSAKRLAVVRPWLFPLGVACLYGLAMLASPEKTARSWAFCLTVAGQLALPLCAALGIMIVCGRYLSPALVTRFLGGHVGVKGLLLSSLAGILSMGPIYAWFPLFKNVRDKGASAVVLAAFMGCRSVKPALLPLFIGYFGWKLAVVFVFMNLGVALCTACAVGRACPPPRGVGDQDAA